PPPEPPLPLVDPPEPPGGGLFGLLTSPSQPNTMRDAARIAAAVRRAPIVWSLSLPAVRVCDWGDSCDTSGVRPHPALRKCARMRERAAARPLQFIEKCPCACCARFFSALVRDRSIPLRRRTDLGCRQGPTRPRAPMRLQRSTPQARRTRLTSAPGR